MAELALPVPHRFRTGSAPVPHRCRRRSAANPHGYLQTIRKAKKNWVFFPSFLVFLCFWGCFHVFGGVFFPEDAAPHIFRRSARDPHCAPHLLRTFAALAPHLCCRTCCRTCAALVPHLCRTCAALVPHLFRSCAALVPHCGRISDPPPCAPANGRPGFPVGFLGGAGGRLPKARRGRVFIVQYYY